MFLAVYFERRNATLKQSKVINHILQGNKIVALYLKISRDDKFRIWEQQYFKAKNTSYKIYKKQEPIIDRKFTVLVKNNTANIVKFATEFEDEFVKIVVDEDYKRIQATQKKNLEALNKMLSRDKELDTLCEKVFEEKILGNLSEERFLKLSGKYEEEQFELKAQIKNMKRIVAEEKKHELNADGFLKIVRKYSEIEELTLDIL